MAWIREKVELIHALPPLGHSSKARQMALLSMVELLLSGQHQLRQLKQTIQELAVTRPEVELLKTMPGVGESALQF